MSMTGRVGATLVPFGQLSRLLWPYIRDMRPVCHASADASKDEQVPKADCVDRYDPPAS